MKYYTLEDKPDFKDGEIVRVNMAKMGMPELGILNGKIVGKGMEHVIDFWLVNFNRTFPDYPYQVVSIIHTAFIKE